MKKLYLYLHRENGIAATEFAFVAPIFILLFIGLVDFGLYLNSKMNIQNISGSIADYVAASKDDTEVPALVNTLMADTGETGLSYTTTFECECSDGVIRECPISSCGDGDFERRFVSVSVSGSYSPLLPYPGVSDHVAISKASRMRVD
ncbi:MAG: pilus assembly protein [Rhodospirillales bacterium]|nr:pilus assembly protein [Rhodospirillales bacterium]MCB9965652.1 pilus assembly protein [Rhodospirillales bacterium]MCB9973076.1 pilus assembly protein [Rhodospirillales bacterium]